jgi:hypothetical protein
MTSTRGEPALKACAKSLAPALTIARRAHARRFDAGAGGRKTPCFACKPLISRDQACLIFGRNLATDGGGWRMALLSSTGRDRLCPPQRGLSRIAHAPSSFFVLARLVQRGRRFVFFLAPTAQDAIDGAQSGGFSHARRLDAGVAELVDAPDLGSGDESRGGSSPSARTMIVAGAIGLVLCDAAGQASCAKVVEV